jgi:hypothetical protein
MICLHRALSPFVCCLVIATLSVKAEGRIDLSGQWKSGVTANPALGKQPECKWLAFSERTITLDGAPGASNRMTGSWKRETTYLWLTNNGGACRWGDEKVFNPTLTGTVTYSVNATYDPDGKSLNVSGVFAGCSGDACSKWDANVINKPFQTKLLYREAGLIDTDPASNGSVRFIRSSDADLRCQEAIAAADKAVAALDRGDYTQFFSSTWTANTLAPEIRVQTQANFSAARDKRGPITSRQMFRTVYSEYSPEISKTIGDYVLLIRDVRSSKGITGQEFTLMGKQNDTWRLIWLDYGCNGPCADASDTTNFGR